MAKAAKPYKVPHRLVEVCWDDAASNSETWVDLKTLEGAPELVVTVGFLVKETAKAYVVAGSVANEDIEDETVGNTMIIPKGMVTSFRYVRLETVKPKAKRKKPNAAHTPPGPPEPDDHDDGAEHPRKSRG